MLRTMAAAGVAALMLIGGGPAAPAAAVPTPGPTPGPTPSPVPYSFPYQPLWPFPDQAAADNWLQERRPLGESLWHADPAATALKFTREFLGFTDLDRTTTVNVAPGEAWVGVGQADPRGQPVTVATLHLARLGPAADAPWAVVGSEDTELTLDTPAYGSPVTPVLAVGGIISGVDESLHVQARQLSGLIGESCCLPAGGQRSPWSVSVPVSGAAPGAVTVVVSTGGHYANIERFAITGLRAN